MVTILLFSRHQQHHPRQQSSTYTLLYRQVRLLEHLLFWLSAIITLFVISTTKTNTTAYTVSRIISNTKYSVVTSSYDDYYSNRNRLSSFSNGMDQQKLQVQQSFSQYFYRYFMSLTSTEQVGSDHHSYQQQQQQKQQDDEHSSNNNNNNNNKNNTILFRMSQLLDRALVLRRRMIHSSNNGGSSGSVMVVSPDTTGTSWQWLVQQLDESIIPYLIQQYRIISLSTSPVDDTDTKNGPIIILQQQLEHYERLFQEMTLSVSKYPLMMKPTMSFLSTTTENPVSSWTANSDQSLTNYCTDTMNTDDETTAPSYTPVGSKFNQANDDVNMNDDDDDDDTSTTNVMNQVLVDTEQIDVIIIGSGLSGLCAGAILNTIYHKKVAIFESHSLPGGCAHAFTRTIKNKNSSSEKLTFTFDSGPSILLGCSTTTSIPNALQQVLQLVQQNVSWIPYSGWNMIERMNDVTMNKTKEWTVSLGPTDFIYGPLYEFGGAAAVSEFYTLRNLTQSLTMGVSIPAMSMRSGPSSIVPLVLRHFSTLLGLIQQGETVTGTFAPYMDGPIYIVKSPWLRDWLDALAFSLSGLPAARTAAAAMAFVLQDMHRSNATLDYPQGGMGEIVNALVRAVEQGPHGSRVYVNQHVVSIDGNADASKIIGVTLRKNAQQVLARNGVICNAPVWSLRNLIQDERIRNKLNLGMPLLRIQPKPPVSWTTTDEGSSINVLRGTRAELSSTATSSTKSGLISTCETIEMTASFIHLHVALNNTGLGLQKLAAHYTVMDRSLSGDPSILVNGIVDGPCSIGNMIAVSNPCVLDATLAPEGYIVMHAYGAGNEPYEIWEGLKRNTPEYIQLKEERAQPLWRALECIIPDVRDRVVLQMIGTPLTHERFLRRPRGTYGSVTEDYLRDGSTPYSNFILASDSIFPGIGVPAVAIVGASAANSMVGVVEHLMTLNRLKRERRLLV